MPGAIGRPLYLQVADDLRSQVISGALPVGSAIPSTAQLMKIYEVSSSAARAAVAELRRQGIVVGQPGKAVYVRATPEAAREERVNIETLGKEVRELRRRVELIGSHLVALYERVGQPYPYDSLNEVIEQPAVDVAKRGR
jgi:DNA-binding GntR family transcriptional regulator